MDNLLQENENLKRKLKLIEEDRDELKVALHIITVHYCHIIEKKECEKIKDVYNEITESVRRLIVDNNFQ